MMGGESCLLPVSMSFNKIVLCHLPRCFKSSTRPKQLGWEWEKTHFSEAKFKECCPQENVRHAEENNIQISTSREGGWEGGREGRKESYFIIWYIHWPKRVTHLLHRNCSCCLGKCEGKLKLSQSQPVHHSQEPVPGMHCLWGSIGTEQWEDFDYTLRICAVNMQLCFLEVNVPLKMTEINLRYLSKISIVCEISKS